MTVSGVLPKEGLVPQYKPCIDTQTQKVLNFAKGWFAEHRPTFERTVHVFNMANTAGYLTGLISPDIYKPLLISSILGAMAYEATDLFCTRTGSSEIPSISNQEAEAKVDQLRIICEVVSQFMDSKNMSACSTVNLAFKIMSYAGIPVERPDSEKLKAMSGWEQTKEISTFGAKMAANTAFFAGTFFLGYEHMKSLWRYYPLLLSKVCMEVAKSLLTQESQARERELDVQKMTRWLEVEGPTDMKEFVATFNRLFAREPELAIEFAQKFEERSVDVG